MDLLSRKEELILLAIWKLKDDAYGITIREELVRSTGVKWLFGSIYTPLNKLFDKGLISKSENGQSSDSGGRPRVYFTLTPSGMDALIKIKELTSVLWSDIPPLSNEK